MAIEYHGENTIEKVNLGAVSAYAVAKKNGFAGTEAEWEQYIANASVKAQQAAASASAAAASAEEAATYRGEIRDQNQGLFVRYDQDATLTEASQAQFRKNIGLPLTANEAMSLLGETAARLGAVTVYADMPGFWNTSGHMNTNNPGSAWHTRMVPVKGFTKIYGRTYMDSYGYAIAYFDQDYQLLSEISVVGTGNMRFGNNAETEPLTIPAAACYASLSGWGRATDYAFVFWGPVSETPGRMETRGVSYADFGARMDGVHDDTEAVMSCHAYANEHGCPVIQHSGTVYMETAMHRLNGERHNVEIKTDVDWTGTTFLIKPPIEDERIVFAVSPDEEKDDVDLSPEQIDQLHDTWLNIPFLRDYPNEIVTFQIEKDSPDIVIGMRDGWQESSYPDPSYYSETVTTDRNGALMDGHLFLDISSRMPRDENDTITGRLTMRRRSTMDKPITIKGGTFKLDHDQRFANPYYLYISRSNVTVEGLKCDAGTRHEIYQTQYRGELIRADYAYNLCFRDCVMENFGTFFPWENRYTDNVSYVLVCTHCSNILIDHCQFLRGWGPIQTSWCKRLTVRDSMMGRVDNHYGCRDYLIQGCTMVTSHSNINVGYGDGYLTVRDTKFIKTRDYDTMMNSRLVYCREDYCSIFQGNITLENIQIETDYETTVLYAALESSYPFRHEPGNQMLPMKLPKVRMKNIYFKHLSAQPVKLTLAEYGVRAEASALSYGNVLPDDMIIDGVWSDQPVRILPMLEHVRLTGGEDWVIKVKNFDCRIDVAEDDTIAPSENIAFDLPLVWLLRDPELYFENRIHVFDDAARETEANRIAAGTSATAADHSADDAASSAAAAAQSAREAQAIAHLTIDSAPTAGSANPVASGGAKTALDGKVSKSGDAMTGNLTNTKGFCSDQKFQVRDYDMDVSAQTMQSTVSRDAFMVTDTGNSTVGIFRVIQKTDSEIQTQIGARRQVGNGAAFNTILLGVAADGTQTVDVSNGHAWRRALSCEVITADLGTITGTGSTVTVTKTVAGVTSDMTPCMIDFGTPNAVLGDVTITTAANSVRFSAKVCGSTTVKVKLSNNSDVSGT